MAVYAIGDVQGCHDPLLRLLDLLRFDPAADVLWLVGDLVNRGPHSVEVLRLVHGLGERAVTVLGNHDLTLLAVAAGRVKPKRKDTFHTILAAPDQGELLDWLRRRPLLHHDPALGFTLVHAGLPPQWDLELAQSCAVELEATLRGPNCEDFLAHMFGGEPRRWTPPARSGAKTAAASAPRSAAATRSWRWANAPWPTSTPGSPARRRWRRSS